MVETALDAWTTTEHSFQTDEEIIESINKPYEATHRLVTLAFHWKNT